RSLARQQEHSLCRRRCRLQCLCNGTFVVGIACRRKKKEIFFVVPLTRPHRQIVSSRDIANCPCYQPDSANRRAVEFLIFLAAAAAVSALSPPHHRSISRVPK